MLRWFISSLHLIAISVAIVIVSMIRDPRNTHKFSRQLFRNVIRLAGAGHCIRYSKDYDPGRTAIYVCNHVNVFDPFVVYAAMPRFFRGLELQSHYKIPGYGWMLSRFHHIPIPSQLGKSELKALARQMQASLGDGVNLLFFPEGHRTQNGRVAEFQTGIFRLVRSWGYPIVPMSITGSYQLKNRHSWLLKPAKINVYLHAMVETEAMGVEEAKGLGNRLREIIAKPVDLDDHFVPGMFDLEDYTEVSSVDKI